MEVCCAAHIPNCDCEFRVKRCHGSSEECHCGLGAGEVAADLGCGAQDLKMMP